MVRGMDYIGVSVLCYCMSLDKKWVVHKRGPKTKVSGVYNFITGKLEFDEQPNEAAAREVLEEYGVEPIKMIPLESHVSVVVDPGGNRHHWLMLPYFVVLDAELIKADEDEVEDVSTVDEFDDIPKPRHNGLMPSIEHHREKLEELRNLEPMVECTTSRCC